MTKGKEVGVIVPDMPAGIAGRLVVTKLGAPCRQKGKRGYQIDATFEIAIGDDHASSVKLPQEYNHYSTALKIAAAGGCKKRSEKRTLGIDGHLKIEDSIDGNLELVFPDPVPCTIKGDTMIATQKNSRYAADVTLFVTDAMGIARITELLDCDVRIQFIRPGAATALPPEPGDELDADAEQRARQESR
ncbi:MAG TPA: hypothetical protein VM513_13340 [Kofleriaceae bacterium]|nr:hypothetical protein [Kofleriaceae bacterium]